MLARLTPGVPSRVFALTLFLSLHVAASSGAQETGVNLIEDEIEGLRTSFFRLGPFYVTPSFRFGTGYDSNPLSTPDAESDVNLVAGPSVRLATPIGGVAFIAIDEEVDYVWYREQTELRQLWNFTQVGGGFGSRRFIVNLGGGLRDQTARPTSEFDFPVQEKSTNLDGALTLALGWRHQLNFAYSHSSYEIVEGTDDPAIFSRLNRDEDRVVAAFSRRLTAKTNAIAEAFVDEFSFQDDSRNADSYGARFGFEFSPSGGDPFTTKPPVVGSFLNGRFLLGFRSVEPFDPERVAYKGLVGSVDVTFGFGERQRLQGLYSRDIVPSIFDQNWYFVENRYGATFHYQVTGIFSVTPGIIFGKNRYPLPSETPIGEEEIFDDHRTYL
ncbi:MAG: hypothetical protein ACRD21_22460, partial [Vicinamibacteria bacterium]